MPTVAAAGGVACRKGGDVLWPLADDGTLAVDQKAVKTTSSEMQQLSVPVCGQIDLKLNIRGGGIYRVDATQNLDVVGSLTGYFFR